MYVRLAENIVIRVVSELVAVVHRAWRTAQEPEEEQGGGGGGGQGRGRGEGVLRCLKKLLWCVEVLLASVVLLGQLEERKERLASNQLPGTLVYGTVDVRRDLERS